MTTPQFTLRLFACVSLVSLLSACGVPSDGYYDANGNFVSNITPHEMASTHPALPNARGNYPADSRYYSNNSYDRAGYYDRNGYYIERNNGFAVPDNMFPPRGMCRVWFTDRNPSQQPAVESCDGIKSRVPAGAYVIFGG